jgi:hypothetical protein
MAPIFGAIFFKSIARRDVSTRANNPQGRCRASDPTLAACCKSADFARLSRLAADDGAVRRFHACDKLTLPATK